MDYRHFLLLIPFIGMSIETYRILRRQPRNSTNTAFVVFGFTICGWIAALMIFLVVRDPETVTFFVQMIHAIAVVIATAWLSFALHVRRRALHPLLFLFVHFILPALTFFLMIAPHVLVASVSRQPWGNDFTLIGTTHALFSLFMFLYLSIGIYVLVNEWRIGTSLLRQQLVPVMISASIAGVFAFITSIIFVLPPFHTTRFFWMGPLLTVVLVYGIHDACSYLFGIPMSASAARMIDED